MADTPDQLCHINAINVYLTEQRTKLHRLYKVACKVAARNGAPKPTNCMISISNTFPEWQTKTIEYILAYEQIIGSCPDGPMFVYLANPDIPRHYLQWDYKAKQYQNDFMSADKKQRERIIALVKRIFDNYVLYGHQAITLALPYNELTVLRGLEHSIPGLNIVFSDSNDAAAYAGNPSYTFT